MAPWRTTELHLLGVFLWQFNGPVALPFLEAAVNSFLSYSVRNPTVRALFHSGNDHHVDMCVKLCKESTSYQKGLLPFFY